MTLGPVRPGATPLGTPRLIWNMTTNAPHEVTDFDEFGIKLSDSNATFDMPFGFAGGLFDADTKLTRFGARDYDASIGRWTRKDPIRFEGDGPNLYTYAYNDPTHYRDPTGQKSCKDYCDLAFGVGLLACIGGCTRLGSPTAIGACMGACGAAVFGGTKYCEDQCNEREEEDEHVCR